jgi:PadR family transcriptional regulator PadR
MGELDRQLLSGNAETLLLALLAEGEQYGYHMRQELAARSRHYFQFAFGRLYPLLTSLERRRLVRSRWVKPAGMRERKQYAITALGRTELRVRKQAWRQFSAAMARVLDR